MRIRLARRSELFVPLLLLLPALLGRTREVAALAAACALGRLCTLCGAEGFRRAAAGEVSLRRTSGAWTGALLATFLLIAVFGLAARQPRSQRRFAGLRRAFGANGPVQTPFFAVFLPIYRRFRAAGC